jgi:hypothetical protein
MSLEKLDEFYRDREERFSRELVAIRQKINTVSTSRIFIALLTMGSVYCAIRFSSLLYILAAALVVVFVALVIQHNRLFRAKQHAENLVKINRREAAGLRGSFSDFDTGSEFLDPHHAYAHDLDIFGDGSLYQCLNRTNTLDARDTGCVSDM